MEVEYLKSFSSVMNGDMEMKIYGTKGKPVIAFPCQGGRFFDWEDQGMIYTLQDFINDGAIQIFAVDSIDKDPWTNNSIPLNERGRRHLLYERYIIEDVMPIIKEKNKSKKKVLTTGCSMGAYHSVNFLLRYPDYIDCCIALSGVMKLNMFIGDYIDDIVEQCSPILFLESLHDPQYLNKLRKCRIIVCTGQGAWEEEMVNDARQINYLFFQKRIPALVDFWGRDVNHDWPWWKIQLPYFLNKIKEELY